MAVNPYATPTMRTGAAPPPAHALWGGPGRYAVKQVPESTDPEWTTGFSPQLKAGGSTDGSALPDDIRTGHREPPVGENYNDPAWQARQNSEFLKRHSDDHTEEMWKVQQRRVPGGQNPLWVQDREPTRPTARNSPTGYAFQRYWHVPRNAADALGENAVLHFSLADHRRKYQIMTMKPQGRLGVNTYRADPRPWDENLYIPPPAGQHLGGIAGNRNFRL